jgi:hypothetical protein
MSGITKLDGKDLADNEVLRVYETTAKGAINCAQVPSMIQILSEIDYYQKRLKQTNSITPIFETLFNTNDQLTIEVCVRISIPNECCHTLEQTKIEVSGVLENCIKNFQGIQ